MARESRDAVVSLRISDDDHVRLRQVAAARGTSVSELLRSVIHREVQEVPATAATVTGTPVRGSRSPDEGIYWVAHEGAVISGATITIRA